LYTFACWFLDIIQNRKSKMKIKSQDVILKEAKNFIDQYYEEVDKIEVTKRWAEIESQIKNTGTYVHTYEELNYGAKLAWRNSNRCIGRLFWKTLKVIDQRNANHEEAFLVALHDHIEIANGKNKVRSAISIFSSLSNNPSLLNFTIKNYTLIMYAGYKKNEKFIGDPANVDFTKYCQSLGWEGAGTPFDVLPVIYNINSGKDKYHQLPENLITEIKITHPNYRWFENFNLKWYKLPIISNMTLDIGGIIYSAAPFNGWYMLDEVATRNFGDKRRYNILPKIATQLKLDTASPFWKEKALLILNEAVYHSYNEAGATIVDHHTAVDQFMQFMDQETAKDREVTGDWSWLTPPNAGSTTEIFHIEIKDEEKLPNYIHRKDRLST
jgi:nitric-oxide synthase